MHPVSPLPPDLCVFIWRWSHGPFSFWWSHGLVSMAGLRIQGPFCKKVRVSDADLGPLLAQLFSTACVSHPQSALEEFKPALTSLLGPPEPTMHLKPQMPALSTRTCEAGRKAGG